MPQSYELNLRDYWNIFLKRKWLAITAFCVVFFSIFLYTNVQIPVYRASVLIKIDPSFNVPSDMLFPSQSYFWNSLRTTLSDCVKQIVSRPVLESAFEELGYINTQMPQKERNAVIGSLNDSVSAVEIEKTNMIRLDVTNRNPTKAAAIANRIAEVFKRVDAEQKNQQAHNVRIFIESTLADVSQKMVDQENRLRELTAQGAMGTGINLINQIYEIEKKRNDLLDKYTEFHPAVLSIDEQIKELKGQLKNLPKEEFEYGTLKRDFDINEALYISLKQKLSEAQIKEADKVDNIIIINPAIAPRQPFYPDKMRSSAVGMVLGLIFAVTLALITEHLDTSIGRVEDIESFIKVSVLGVIPYCFKKAYGSEKKDMWKRLIKKIFSIKSKKEKTEKVTHDASILAFEKSTGSVFLEAFRILGVNLQVAFGKGGKIKNKILMITSCNPQEGKSVITVNLGVIMSQMGYRVLIIDSDTRRANIHKLFSLSSKEGGLMDILTGKLTFESVVRTATDLILSKEGADNIIDKPWLNNLNILTIGTTFPNPANFFNSEKLNEILNNVRNKYDVVLIDTPPILAVSEPSILIPKVDGTLVVYKVGVTSRLALRRAKIQIESIKKNGLSGIVLNNVTPEVGINTYYYYNKEYYGEKKNAEKKTGSEMKKEGGGLNV